MIISDDILHIITSNIFFNYNRVIFIERNYKQDFVDVNENNKILLKLKTVVNHNHSFFKNIFNDIIIDKKNFLSLKTFNYIFLLHHSTSI